MAVINHAKREINAKIVYYGPASTGKGSLFRYIHQRIKPNLCGPLKSMPAAGDTLLFFDYLPFEHAILDGYQVRLHLYTLSGQVTNPGTWKMVLKGVDGLALVAEAGKEQDAATQQALRSLRAVLAGHGRDLRQLPCLLIANKAEQLEQQVAAGWGDDLGQFPAVRSSTITGEGVVQALASLSQAVVQQLRLTHTVPKDPAEDISSPAAEEPEAAVVPEPVSVQPASLQLPAVQVGQPSIVQLPLTVQVDGQCRRFTLRVTLDLEEVGHGTPGV